ncbi:MAG: DUF1906 domain-containing protein [Gordonia sp. (in: high G+C Gram-positive bacteria)]|uniref:DUF1906 domain-containing protein n=1 Tax=Gordonia sp. (in: high G+C Gram-positive bacteria) TaxID=84139 RepID=UPI003BB7C42B
MRADDLGSLLGSGSASLPPSAVPARLGTLLDYAVGVPTPDAVMRAGHAGVIRYISDRRPGAEYMTGKPLAAAEATAMRATGLAVVSNYQFGKDDTADWKGGYPAGRTHAARGVEIHRAAGGPDGAPIYVSIDDNPTQTQFLTQIAPYLLGWRSVIGAARMGVYANAPTIARVSATGLAHWFWQHDWGTPKGYLHPAAHLHQIPGHLHQIPGQTTVGGVQVDVNTIEKAEYGQWR